MSLRYKELFLGIENPVIEWNLEFRIERLEWIPHQVRNDKISLNSSKNILIFTKLTFLATPQ